MTLNYLRIYTLTRDRKWLQWAQGVHRFVWSGWDEQLSGGIYGHQSRKSKNTCSNAPALVSALWLHAVTRKAEYLQQARQINTWLRTHLQDPDDGLYWDNMQMNGRVDRTKFSYNTAWLFRRTCGGIVCYRGKVTYAKLFAWHALPKNTGLAGTAGR